MKKIFVLFITAAILSTIGFADEKETIKTFNELYKQKNFEAALETINKGIEELGPSQGLMKAKYRVLVSLKKYDEALQILDMAIQLMGEPANLLNEKSQLLMHIGRYEEALSVALKMEEKSEKKSPWGSLNIAMIYNKLGKKDEVLNWLDISAERGFIDYSMLYQKEFSALQDNERFKNIISKIKDNLGLDKKAKDFSVELLSGKQYTLSKQNGKVTLIDFWATWCGPCRREMPNLKKLYADFKDKGFEIIGICLDESQEPLDEYIKKEQIDWKIAFSGAAWADATAKTYSVNSIPSYWLVDKNGTLRYFGLRGKKLRDAVVELLAE